MLYPWVLALCSCPMLCPSAPVLCKFAEQHRGALFSQHGFDARHGLYDTYRTSRGVRA